MFRVDVGCVLQQAPGDFDVAILGRLVQRSPAVLVCRVDVGSAAQVVFNIRQVPCVDSLV
jgi:hypothetical protein